MTQNYHTESILISGMTVRNLIHEFSIWGPSGGFVDSITPQLRSPGAKCTAEWTFRCLEDLHRDVRSGPSPWCKSTGSYILASGQGPEVPIPLRLRHWDLDQQLS